MWSAAMLCAPRVCAALRAHYAMDPRHVAMRESYRWCRDRREWLARDALRPTRRPARPHARPRGGP